MKNELRIGNLLKDSQFKKPIIVTIGVLEEIENGMNFYDPIPISDEILINQGYTYDPEDSDYLDFKIPDDPWGRILSFCKLDNTLMISNKYSEWTVLAEVNYVHSYQNIYFATTGKEWITGRE